jgi:hypothetical protein
LFVIGGPGLDLNAPGLGDLLGGITVAALIVLLVLHQLAAAAGPRFQSWARNSAVAIAPLLIVFFVLVVEHLYRHA